MQVRSRLIDVAVPDRPEGVVLVVHGGAGRDGGAAVSPGQLSVVRMIPLARRIARAGRHRLAVFRLLNSSRGWDPAHTPVDDIGWALDEIRGRLGSALPTSLVGHSLGGRAVLLAAGREEVVSAVALAPWVYPNDGAAGLRRRRILIVHGTDDRIASPANSAAVARTLARTAEVTYLRVDGGKHAMLGHRGEFEGPAVDFVVTTLLGVAAS